MTEIEQFEYINNLLITYGEILTPLQKEVLTCYYSYNLSLGEIAVERKVTRAAVDDALKKGISKLKEFEDKLKTYEKSEKILKITAKLKQNSNNREINKEIEEIERILTDGI